MTSFKQLILAVFIFSICGLETAPATACSFSNRRMSPDELKRNALSYFRESEAVYEGIMLGSHDYETGGNLLVLKSYKGPASPLTIVRIEPGNSCYGGVPFFATGFIALPKNRAGFDDFVTDSTVQIWRDAGLVDGGIHSPSTYARGAMAITICLLLAALVLSAKHALRRFN